MLSRVCSAMPEAALSLRRFLARRGAPAAAETAPRRGHALELGPLLGYLAPAIGCPVEPERVRLSQFSHGQSNPTFTLRWDGGAVVVRKQPDGSLLKGAHDVRREHAFARHLVGVPTPVARALCTDATILGTDFWVYDYVEGRHFVDPYLERAPTAERPALFRAAMEAAAGLHGSAPTDGLLEAIGGAPRTGYLERQVRTWTRQYEAADARVGEATAAATLDHAARLAAAVDAHAAAVDETRVAPAHAFVAHGDFRCDNMVFSAAAPEVAVLLDWELAAFGHPYSDVAYITMPYAIPPLPAGPLSGFAGLDGAKHGIPPVADLVDAYAARARAPGGARAAALAALTASALPHHELFQAVGFFRIASIVRGVYARAAAGNASSASAAAVGALAATLLGASAERADAHAAVQRGERAPLALRTRG